jgi:hypothetical protein
MRFFRSILLFTAVAAAPSWAQRPSIQVSVDPSRSRNGEQVLFKISVSINDRGRMEKPELGSFSDWEIVSSFRSESPRVVMTNGRVQYQYKADYSYFLRPIKVGTLKIPSVKVVVAGQDYRTEALNVIVDRLPGGQNQRPRVHNRPPPSTGPNVQYPDENLSGGNSASGGTATGRTGPSDIPANESFFIRPEINKTEAWAGELLTLNYVLYQRTRNLNAPEMSKFPDFKGFLKEELFITKNFQQERVQIGSEIFFRSELIRYAVFPIKTGNLKIDEFKFKAEVFTSPGDLIQSLMLGTPPPTMGGGPIPMEKSSGVLPILSKPLPATPPGAVFTGAVGNFEIELKGPTASVPAGTPFTLSLTIAGKGNVKMIEDVPIKLPPELELSRTTNLSEIRQDASGYKTFEYQILPRTVGDYRLDPVRFTYFDPDTGDYKTLESRPFLVSVEGGSSQAPGAEGSPSAPKEQAFNPVRSGPQDLLTWSPGQRGPGTSFADHRLFWILHGVLYALFGVAFARRRKDEAQLAYLQRSPWEVTAKSIRALDPRKSVELAILVDQWMREKLAGQLGERDLHAESARADIEFAARKRLPPEFHRNLEALRQLWSDLDVIRFAGSKKIPEGIVAAELFMRAQKTVESILARKRSDEELAQ